MTVENGVDLETIIPALIAGLVVGMIFKSVILSFLGKIWDKIRGS